VRVAPSGADETFPAGTPEWLVRAGTALAHDLGDDHPRSVTVTLGRFPVVVLEGDFTCTGCHGPSGAAPPTGTVAAARYDAVTRAGRDFAFCGTRAACLSGLCNGRRCTRAAIALDSAFAELYRRAPGVDFDHRLGRNPRCHLTFPTRRPKWIYGDCSVGMTITARRTVVTFTQRWRGLDRNGRRATGPKRWHGWRIELDAAGGVKSYRSRGDRPPQLRR
jgi:hypothetical protein